MIPSALRRPRTIARFLAIHAAALFLACSNPPTKLLRAPETGGALDADPIELWLEKAEALRELELIRPVEVRPIYRFEVAQMIGDDIARAFSAEQAEVYRDAYAALGAWPRDLDLVKTFTDLYGGQMVGRYDAHAGALYIVEGRMLGGYERETVAVHELVHALQHQHYPYALELAERLRTNDDLVTAISAAIEGDASLTMFEADLDPATKRDRASALRFRDMMMADVIEPTGAMARAPALVRHSVVFPYAFGTLLAADRYAAAGNAGLDGLLYDLPLSTLSFLNANRERPEPASVDWVLLPEALERDLAQMGCSLRHQNVAGALTIRVLLDGADVPASGDLVSGWRGDRFAHVRCAERDELIWLTRWVSGGAAREFAEAYRGIAPRIAAVAPLAGTPLVREAGRSVLVLSPALAPLAEDLLDQSRIATYASFRDWLADDCPGELGGCPLEGVEAAGAR